MGPVYVCFWYDTEDFVQPLSDDAALRIAQLHTRHGVPATFKVVGEKARRLRDRGRQDVIAALAAHDLGYHSDLHSAHPTVTEYCEPLTFAHGESLFRRLETQGFHDVQSVFARPCTTFGQAGAAWAPQVYPVLRQWGVPTYVDEGPWIGLNEAPFWYMGLLHVFRMKQNGVRFPVSVPGAELDAVAVFNQLSRQLGEGEGGVISIYFHPLEWVTEAFWDALNFADGVNPPERADVVAGWHGEFWRPDVRLDWPLEPPPVAPFAERERRFEALGNYLRHVHRSGVRAIGCGDLMQLYPDHAIGRWYSADELVEATGDWYDSVSYCRVAHGWLSAGEVLTALCGLLVLTESEPGQGRAPVLARAEPVDGPHDDVPPLRETVLMPFDFLVSAAVWLLAQTLMAPSAATVRPVLPAGIPVGPLTVRPEEFLMGCVRALRTITCGGEAPDDVELGPTRLTPAEHVRGGPETFVWPCFPAGFDAPNVIAHAARQTWTLKPALPAPAS